LKRELDCVSGKASGALNGIEQRAVDLDGDLQRKRQLSTISRPAIALRVKGNSILAAPCNTMPSSNRPHPNRVDERVIWEVPPSVSR
jgi:hypothetical protein